MPNNTKGGPSSTRQRNAISDDGPTLNTGLVALWFFRGSVPVLLRNPFVISQGGVRTPVPSPPLDPRMTLFIAYACVLLVYCVLVTLALGAIVCWSVICY